MLKLYPGKKVIISGKNISVTLYGKEAELVSALAVLTLVWMALVTLAKALK